MTSNMAIAIMAYLDYLNNFDFLALPCKAGNFTKFLVFDRDSARRLVKDELTRKLWKLDGVNLRWKGGMVDKVKQAHIPAPVLEITVAKRWDEFEWHAGNRSAAQEKAVCEGLNGKVWLGHQWKHVGTERPEEGKYNPDVISDNGIMIEVKGFNSPIYKH